MEPKLQRLCDNIGRVIVGKHEVIRLAIAALLARGHVLIEDAPGLGKTLLARALAQSLDATFKRIQFTPDLLPTDITGVSIYNPREQNFEFIPGPVFTQVLLADEINRTSPRTQSSLLEAMEERQVTMEGRTWELPCPFFVLATQNPIELTGTFPLPEAQIDRFLIRLEMGYPEGDEEVEILRSHIHGEPVRDLGPVLAVEELLELQGDVRAISVSPEIQRYIVELSAMTRSHPDVRLGISPRGSLALMRVAQAYTLLLGETYVTPDIVKQLVSGVFSHRLVLDPHREYTGTTAADVVRNIIEHTPVPVRAHGASIADIQG